MPSSPASLPARAHVRALQIRVNTTMVYKQNKFNLLREESEGYAKLITTLNRFGADAISEASAAEEIKTVQSLIGYFDLDPNRVFDLLLDWCGVQAGCRPEESAARVRRARYRYPSLLEVYLRGVAADCPL